MSIDCYTVWGVVVLGRHEGYPLARLARGSITSLAISHTFRIDNPSKSAFKEVVSFDKSDPSSSTSRGHPLMSSTKWEQCRLDRMLCSLVSARKTLYPLRVAKSCTTNPACLFGPYSANCGDPLVQGTTICAPVSLTKKCSLNLLTWTSEALLFFVFLHLPRVAGPRVRFRSNKIPLLPLFLWKSDNKRSTPMGVVGHRHGVSYLLS